VESLRRQTFGDWVCELHNDDPADKFPEQLVEKIADTRFRVVTHEVNYGPTRSFNQFFKPIAEPYFSILEDDNWWEPAFLQKMVATLDAYPEIQLAWANMRRWVEQADGTWADTGRDLWNRSPDSGPELFYWPQQRQVMGGLHSQGAMLARSGEYMPIPEGVNSAAMEMFRERTFHFPILLVPESLANFAVTLTSSRPGSRSSWTYTLALLAGSFAEVVPMLPESMASLWRQAWGTGRTKSTAVLVWGAFVFPGARKLLRHAGLRDWSFFVAYYAKHPLELMRTLQLFRRNHEEREFLLKHTRARLQEAVERGFVAF
jgi:hypothetical protein